MHKHELCTLPGPLLTIITRTLCNVWLWAWQVAISAGPGRVPGTMARRSGWWRSRRLIRLWCRFTDWTWSNSMRRWPWFSGARDMWDERLFYLPVKGTAEKKEQPPPPFREEGERKNKFRYFLGQWVQKQSLLTPLCFSLERLYSTGDNKATRKCEI